jgi:hypothetical protein
MIWATIEPDQAATFTLAISMRHPNDHDYIGNKAALG